MGGATAGLIVESGSGDGGGVFHPSEPSSAPRDKGFTRESALIILFLDAPFQVAVQRT